MGGGGPAPSNSTVTQTTLSKEAKPFYKDLMKRAKKESDTDYIPYEDERLAQMDPYVSKGIRDTQRLYDSGTPWLKQAMPWTKNAAGDFQDLSNYKANTISAYYNPTYKKVESTYNYRPDDVEVKYNRDNWTKVRAQLMGTKYIDASLDQLPQYQKLQFGLQPDEKVSTDQWSGSAYSQYKNPYAEEVIDSQRENMYRDYNRQNAQRALAAAKSGSFGGSREAVGRYLAEEGMNDRLRTFEADSRNENWRQAQAMFSTDQARALQAAQSNQDVSSKYAMANQQTKSQYDMANAQRAQQYRLANQQSFMTSAANNQQAAMQARLANQQTDLSAAHFFADKNMQAQMANQQSGMQNAQFRQDKAMQARLANQQRDLETRQYKADLMLKAGTADSESKARAAGIRAQGAAGLLQSGEQAAALEAQRQAINSERIKQLMGAGAQRQAYKQSLLDLKYSDFINQRDWKKQQLQFYNSAIRGVPVGVNSNVSSYQPYNPLQALMGAGIGGLALSQMFR